MQAKNKVMAVAFGKTEDDEYMPNMSGVGKMLNRSGEAGILFTNRSRQEVEKFFRDFQQMDYARAGTVATRTFVAEVGPLEGWAGSMEPMLRKLGLPTTLKTGVIHVDRAYPLCTEGEVLNAEQCKLLKLFDYKLVEFQLKLLGMWEKQTELFFELGGE